MFTTSGTPISALMLRPTSWHRMLKRHLQKNALDGKAVLEIGCGRGDFSCWLRKNFATRLTAADFSSTAVDKGRQFAASLGLDITWDVMDIQSIPRPDASFEVVISRETIEHVPDPALAVRELGRVLKPGGTLFDHSQLHEPDGRLPRIHASEKARVHRNWTTDQ